MNPLRVPITLESRIPPAYECFIDYPTDFNGESSSDGKQGSCPSGHVSATAQHSGYAGNIPATSGGGGSNDSVEGCVPINDA